MLLRRFAVPLVGVLCALMVLSLIGCAPRSLVSQQYEASFYEAPRTLSDSLEAETPTFVVFGDTQSGWRAEHKFYRRDNWVTWKHLLFPFYQTYLLANGIVGVANWKRQVPDMGSGSRALMRRAIARAADSLQADFLLHLGDMGAHDGRRAEHWALFIREYLGPASPLRDYPMLPVVGNHEYANDTLYGLPNFEAIFDYPGFYVQDMPHAALFVLNSNYLIDQHNFLDDDTQDRLFEEWFVSSDTSSAQAWLERELERRKDRPFKIVAMHHPPISFSWHIEDWHERYHGRDLLLKRNRLLELLQQYNVQVIFSGHEHLYEHNMLRYRWTDGDPRLIHQVISSGGGTPLRKAASGRAFEERMALYEEEGLDVKSVMQRSVFHYTTVEVTPDTLTVETYAVDEADPLHNELLDRILIPRPQAMTAPEPQVSPGR